MKKIILLVSLITILFAGCSQTPDEIKQQIRELNEKKFNLQDEILAKTKKLNEINEKIKINEEKLNLLEHKVAGDIPKYILTLELRQSHFTLDIGKHLQDTMNKVEFDISVDEELYNNQTVGQEFLREFRKGSLILNGSFGDWVIVVVGKRIEYIKSE